MNDHAKFDSLVKHTPAFVKFYMDGCIHCVNMAAEWEKMAKMLDEAMSTSSAGALLALTGDLPLGDQVAARALKVVQETVANEEIVADVVIFGRDGALLGRAGSDGTL